jgi:hypothetical protein
MLMVRGARGTRKVGSVSLVADGLGSLGIAAPVVVDPRVILGVLVEIVEGPLMM